MVSFLCFLDVMNESVVDLLGAHDLLTPDQDVTVVKKYLETLDSFQCVGSLSNKDLQELTASVNVCLSSAHGTRNGLLALRLLLEQCSAEYFNQHAAKFLSTVVHQILGKQSTLTAATTSLACRVLVNIVEYAPAFPDVSKHLSSLASGAVSSLILAANTFPSCVGSVLSCLAALMTTYSGSCGSSVVQIEKFVVNRIAVERQVPTEALARVYALLPRLGGGGKDGALHKEAWTKQLSTCLNTMTHLFQQLKSMLPRCRDAAPGGAGPAMALPAVPASGMGRAYGLAHQFRTLSRLVSAMMRGPFPHAKRFRSSSVLEVVKAVFDLRLTVLAGHVDHESKMVLAALPALYKAAVALLVDLVRTLGLDLLPHQDGLFKMVLQVFKDLRQIGGIEGQSVKARPLADIKMGLHDLLGNLDWGWSEFEHADELMAFVVSDFVPASETVQLATSGMPKVAKQRKKRKPAAGTFLGNTFSNAVNRLDRASGSTGPLARASLRSTTHLLATSGPYLNPSIHKSVQSAVLSACFKMQGDAAFQPPFDDPEARSALYDALMAVISGSSSKWPRPLSYGIHIFSVGKADCHLGVRATCARHLVHCQSLTHPPCQSLDLDMPMSQEDIKDVMKDMMKVHTIVLASGITTAGQSSFVLPELSGRKSPDTVAKSIEETNGSDEGHVTKDEPQNYKN